jgi:hypothetical protein
VGQVDLLGLPQDLKITAYDLGIDANLALDKAGQQRAANQVVNFGQRTVAG